MGWGAGWRAASVQFGAEPVEIRILVFVAAAFAVLLVLIGLRHAFRPAGPAKSEPALPAPPARLAAAAPQAAPAPVPSPFRAKKPVVRPFRKAAKTIVNRQRTPRPQIRRAH